VANTGSSHLRAAIIALSKQCKIQKYTVVHSDISSSSNKLTQ